MDAPRRSRAVAIGAAAFWLLWTILLLYPVWASFLVTPGFPPEP